MKPVVYAYSPFLRYLGGGEKYFASILDSIQNAMDVKLICHEGDMPFLDRIRSMFDLDLLNVSVISAVLESETDIQSMVPFDSVFFQVSNGVPISINCRKTVLHHQVILPMVDESKASKRYPGYSKDVLNTEIRRRLLSQSSVLFSSRFVKDFMAKHWCLGDGACSVIHPLISDIFFSHPSRDGSKIVSVGRFEQIKKQQAQIELFIKLRLHLPDSCKLVLIGSSRTDLSDALERMAASYPIELKYGLSEKELLREYADASIYWSTTGLGVENAYEGHNVESFGLAMAEAMATGCVPVAIDAGGVSEIINAGENGVLVSNMEEMGAATERMLTAPGLLKHMSNRAHESADRFSKSTFSHQVRELFRI